VSSWTSPEIGACPERRWRAVAALGHRPDRRVLTAGGESARRKASAARQTPVGTCSRHVKCQLWQRHRHSHPSTPDA